MPISEDINTLLDKRCTSEYGIRMCVSAPSGTATFPLETTSNKVSINRPTPSSNISGEDHVRTSSIQVAFIKA